ncbi:MAG: hypothetical protein GXP55_26480 [Deltaproteobacteria bacterium]|nr:hypothetical protein [Deltaproteobacteria bacterium]
MRVGTVWAVGVFIVAGCGATRTPSVENSPPATESMPATPVAGVRVGPMDFDCDTLADHFSRWSTEVGGSSFVVRGEMRFVSEQEHPNWLPTGTLELVAGEEKTFLHATRDPDERLRIGIRHRPSADAEFAAHPLAKLAFTRIPLRFAVQVDGPRVAATLGGIATTLVLHDAVDTFAMSCNTANVVFHGVTIEFR